MQLIQPVIVQAKHQRSLVDNLVKYCLALDGTQLKVIYGQSELPYPHCNNAELHNAATIMKGRPFVWLEPDSIPLKRGWVKAISCEYYTQGKPFLLSSDSHPPHDLVGGIGVYSKDTNWLVPKSFPLGGWDGWMIKHLKPLIARTERIQHSYGTYDSRGIAYPHRFLFDRSMVRASATIFHRDKFQDLTKPVDHQLRFYHTGDLGDIIASLPIIRELGGGDLIIGNHDPLHQGWREMKGTRFEAIRPLLAAQPYVRSVTFEHRAKDISVDLSPFRSSYIKTRSLTASMAEFIKMPHAPDLSPWLTATPSKVSAGRIIVARTDRYHNPVFPWRQIIQKHWPRMLFVGSEDECRAFAQLGPRVEFARTQNLLDLASLIKGSDLFIGNQSCPCWIAMGMGHKLIQETHPLIQDSIIPRDNATFCQDGDLVIEKL